MRFALVALLLCGCSVASEFSLEAEAGCTTSPDTPTGTCGAEYGIVRCSVPLESPPTVEKGVAISCVAPNGERFSAVWCCKKS